MKVSEKKKSVKLGQVLKGKHGEYIKLGNVKNKDPKYNYTVQVRVLDSDGQIVYKCENPNVGMYKPNDGAPDFILNDLAISLKTEA